MKSVLFMFVALLFITQGCASTQQNLINDKSRARALEIHEDYMSRHSEEKYIPPSGQNEWIKKIDVTEEAGSSFVVSQYLCEDKLSSKDHRTECHEVRYSYLITEHELHGIDTGYMDERKVELFYYDGAEKIKRLLLTNEKSFLDHDAYLGSMERPLTEIEIRFDGTVTTTTYSYEYGSDRVDKKVEVKKEDPSEDFRFSDIDLSGLKGLSALGGLEGLMKYFL